MDHLEARVPGQFFHDEEESRSDEHPPPASERSWVVCGGSAAFPKLLGVFMNQGRSEVIFDAAVQCKVIGSMMV